jgi:branched-chain amino acid transport system permease protein
VPALLRRLVIVALVAAALAAIASPAWAEGEAIKGRLVAVFGDEREPVAGVTIEVRSDGVVVGSTTSADDGSWLIPVPGAGTYEVALIESTLPDGVGLTDEGSDVLPDVAVADGQEKTVIFRLGSGTVSTVSVWSRVGSVTVLGLKLGAIIALSAIGLSLVYAVTGLVNFAHAEMVTLGAVVAFFFNASPAGPGWPLWLSAIAGVAFGGLFGLLQDVAMWEPLRRRHTSLVAMMVVSIGLSFALRNIILILFDGEPRSFPDYAGQPAVNILGVPIVPKHVVAIAVAVVVLIGVGLFLQRTRAGTAMRAVADNKDLAESSGINVNRVISTTWVLAGSLAALGGIAFGITETVSWDMGFKLLLLIFAAVVLGGLGTAYGAVVGAFVVGLAVEISTLFVPSELKAAVGLIVLIVMLLIRPQGLLGSKDRVG